MLYSINAVANELGVDRQTIRQWEKTGKVKPAARLQNGHRVYTEIDLIELKAKIIKRQ